jgi:hypothetical protein
MRDGRVIPRIVVALLIAAVGTSLVAATSPGASSTAAAKAKKRKCKKKKRKPTSTTAAAKKKRKCKKKRRPPAPAAPAALSISPASHDFGRAEDVSPPFDFTVTNVGGQASGVPAVSLSGTHVIDFEITGNTCTAPLPPLGSCTISVRAIDNLGADPATAQLDVVAAPGGAISAPLQVTYV